MAYVDQPLMTNWLLWSIMMEKTKVYVTLALGKNNVFSGTIKVNLFIHRHYLIVNTLLKTETWISVWLKLKLFDSVLQASIHSKTPCFTRTGNVN